MQYFSLTIIIRVFNFSKFNISANVALTVMLITFPLTEIQIQVSIN